MGNTSSKQDDGSLIYFKDQQRFFVSSVTITNSKNRPVYRINSDSFPATTYSAIRDVNDDGLVEFVQIPEGNSRISHLLKLVNDDELIFNFTCVVSQSQSLGAGVSASHAANSEQGAPVDTTIAGLTFVFASSSGELDNLVTKEFHANPNLHKNPNVELVGDCATNGRQSVQFQWSWKWKPPKLIEDRGGGWRNICSFVEYDQRANKLNSLASFSFWVQNIPRFASSPYLSPRMDYLNAPKLRVASGQSIESRMSDSEGSEAKDHRDPRDPQSPGIEPIPENDLIPVPTATPNAIKLDVPCQKSSEDPSTIDDGPVFRAMIKQLESKTGSIRTKMKKVLRKAEAAQDAQAACNDAVAAFIESLHEATATNKSAIKPAIDHYFDKIAKEILSYERQNAFNLQKMVVEPVSKLYNIDLKQADAKKRDFEEESKEYYSYVSRYLGQRQDSLKEKKREESDSKYQMKRKNFELKRFDYSSYMHDLHNGRKDQEVLSQLTRYADAQTKCYLSVARKIDELLPGLEALNFEVKEKNKQYQMWRTEREEKRRVLEKVSSSYKEPDDLNAANQNPQNPTILIPGGSNKVNYSSDNEYNQITSPSSSYPGTKSIPLPLGNKSGPPSHGQGQPFVNVGSPGSNRFKGIRDLEEKDRTFNRNSEASNAQRKEGLLWALSRPGSHVDPKGLNKQAWHKFWIVLDQGKLSEYINWKYKMDLHMDPIDLRMASVREARNAERRFCLEVITPQFTRVYQATSEEDMRSWINAVNNALQSAFEGRGMVEYVPSESLPGSTRRDIASVLTGKSSSLSSHRASYQAYTSSTPRAPSRHATVGDRPNARQADADDAGSRLLQQIRSADAGNLQCADCFSSIKVEWVSINLGIVLCIECSGIHRSLGTHISKVRSLTLDTISFTQDTIELLMLIGNRVSNIIWEATLGPNVKPTPMSSREDRLRFITAKYSDHAFVAPLASNTSSHFSSPVEMLLTSIKKNDIKNVLYALALRANPNSTDLSRNTHAVYLALAAADPASPSSSSSATSPPASSSTSPSSRSTHNSSMPRKSFAIAELLLQNGADLPSSSAPFPLSPSAKAFLEHKAAQKNGIRTTNGQPYHNNDAYANPNAPSLISNNTSDTSATTANNNSASTIPSIFTVPSSQHQHEPWQQQQQQLNLPPPSSAATMTNSKPSFEDSKLITALPSILAYHSDGATDHRTKEKKLTKRIGSGAKYVRAGVTGGGGGKDGDGERK